MKKLLFFFFLSLTLGICSCSNLPAGVTHVPPSPIPARTPPGASEVIGKILIEQPSGIFLTTAEGKGSRLIVPQTDGLLNAALSHDGTRIAYFINGFYFIEDLQTGAVSQLNQEFIGGVPYGMGWSPDDRNIGFNCVPPNDQASEICTIDVTQQHFQVLTHLGQAVSPDKSAAGGGARFGSWEEDGVHLIFAVGFYPSSYLSSGGRSKRSLQILNIHTGEIVTIFDEATQSAISAIDSPMLSPDGKTVLFDGNIRQLTEIFQINADGSGLRQVTLGNHASGISHPVWSPDGSVFFAYTASDSDPAKIGIPMLFSLNGNILLQLDIGSGRVLSWVK
jgi:Tol biopolymer transport system component